MSLIKEQLHTETQLYRSLKAEKREDYIAQSVLNRLEREITTLKGKYDKEANRRQEIDYNRPTSRFIRYVKKALSRNWIKLREHYQAIFTISKD